ncbi:deoxyribose-phosphate aldolase [bacterium]|nr:deoxyribose-phosphate aldolase [bacterium]
MSTKLTLRDLSKMIDHSLLHPTMTDEQVRAGCVLSRKYDVATACVKPYSIEMAREILFGSDVAVCAVIGFPHGNSTTAIKVAEAEAAVIAGATEIDMVANVGKVLGGQWDYVSQEIKAINDAVTCKHAILKVIFENDYLQHEHIIRLCEICSEHKTAFVKTSTGYGFVKQPAGGYNYKGATEEHLKLMRTHAAPSVQVKAAGGVRTLDDMLHVRELGVTRIGATATEAILEEAKKRLFGDKTAGAKPAAKAPEGY